MDIHFYTQRVQSVCFDRVCVHMRFELCHPPKHFIPKMKIYKNDCRQTSCAFFLSSNRKESVFLLNSLSFHHHFAFFSLSICINLLLVFFDRTKPERKNIQNDTKYYTIHEKERREKMKSVQMYIFCGIACGVPNHRWHHRIKNRTIQKALLPIFNGPFFFPFYSFTLPFSATLAGEQQYFFGEFLISAGKSSKLLWLCFT